MTTAETALSEYLSGEKLYGDDFTLEEIEGWFRDEEFGFSDLIEEKGVAAAGFEIRSQNLCIFAPLQRLGNRVGTIVYSSTALPRLDQLLSRLFTWNLRYHATKPIQKFRAVHAYFACRRTHASAPSRGAGEAIS